MLLYLSRFFRYLYFTEYLFFWHFFSFTSYILTQISVLSTCCSWPDQFLKKLDTVYHWALCFITGCSNRVPNFTVCPAANCPSLSTSRFSHWFTFMYKSLLGLVPQYLCLYLWRNQNQYGLHSYRCPSVPSVRTELDKKSLPIHRPFVLEWCAEGLSTIWFGNSGGIHVNF